MSIWIGVSVLRVVVTRWEIRARLLLNLFSLRINITHERLIIKLQNTR